MGEEFGPLVAQILGTVLRDRAEVPKGTMEQGYAMAVPIRGSTLPKESRGPLHRRLEKLTGLRSALCAGQESFARPGPSAQSVSGAASERAMQHPQSRASHVLPDSTKERRASHPASSACPESTKTARTAKNAWSAIVAERPTQHPQSRASHAQKDSTKISWAGRRASRARPERTKTKRAAKPARIARSPNIPTWKA